MPNAVPHFPRWRRERNTPIPPPEDEADTPARARKLDFERDICIAVRSRTLVGILLEGSGSFRLFAPYRVSLSAKGSVNAFCEEISEPGKERGLSRLQVIEVASIKVLRSTHRGFAPNRSLMRTADQDLDGPLC